jgi:hypothetical protein
MLKEAEQRKRPEGQRDKPWMLHDNTPAHTSLLVCESLVKHDMTVIPQPLSSSDMAPADLFCFQG